GCQCSGPRSPRLPCHRGLPVVPDALRTPLRRGPGPDRLLLPLARAVLGCTGQARHDSVAVVFVDMTVQRRKVLTPFIISICFYSGSSGGGIRFVTLTILKRPPADNRTEAGTSANPPAAPSGA